jgi:hypothetical protein
VDTPLLPVEVLRALMPAVQTIGEQVRVAVREVELPRIDRIGIAAARAAGDGKYARGHHETMAALGYASRVEVEDEPCRDCGYTGRCRCEYHCANCDVEECERGDCDCRCGYCDWEEYQDD